MESRKSSLASREVCRFCLTQESLTSLYDRSKRPNYLSDLPTQILSCVSVEVFPSDGMPTYICDRCRFFMGISYQFKKICRHGDESLMQYVQKGQALQPVTWPIKLKKLYQISNSTVKPEVKTTLVTEEGTCVEVTSQDQSESEDDEDESSLYVKIETDGAQGSEQGMPSIQLLSPNDKCVKEKLKKQSKGQANITKNDIGVRCQYCDKTLVSERNYIRHLALKHKDARPSHAPYGECEQFCCDQCNEVFYTQDDLIYHSAVHATKNLTCPLCHEKFDDVDAITVHIESHVDGVEFICEECRLVFSSKENLKAHMEKHHGMMAETSLEEEEGTEAEYEEGDDYNFSVKEDGDHMVVQLKNDNFMLSNADKNAKEAESFTEDVDVPYMTSSNIQMTTANVTSLRVESPNVTPQKQHIIVNKASPTKKNTGAMAAIVQSEQEPIKPAEKVSAESKSQTAGILRKAEEMKRKSQIKKVESPVPDKNSNNAGTSTPTGASDKSLKLLEKELQELKRTSNRSDSVKTPTKGEILRGRRTQQLITSTPKPKITEDRSGTRTPTNEKKPVERRGIPTKENQEPKESKEKINVSKEDKTTKQNNNNTPKVKEQPKDVKLVKEDKVSKDKEQKTKSVENNGAADRNSVDENIRRSHRPTKVKDYAKMVKDAATSEEENDDDEEYIEAGSTPEARSKPKKVVKPKTPTAQQPLTKKRGRPRKDVNVEVPAKIMKSTPKSTKEDESMETEEKAVENKIVTAATAEPPATEPPHIEKESQNNQTPVPNQTASPPKAGTILLSPSGQPLRKVQTLPPGVTPIPLPVGARSTLCEMQIGTKFVKVQRIMMTKAEVEDMAKKGLVEMKDGTMVLKQGVKMAAPTGGNAPADSAPKVSTEMKGET